MEASDACKSYPSAVRAVAVGGVILWKDTAAGHTTSQAADPAPIQVIAKDSQDPAVGMKFARPPPAPLFVRFSLDSRHRRAGYCALP
jgi:hypothetical protein